LAGVGLFAIPQISQGAQIEYSSLVTAKNPLSYYQIDEAAGSTTAIDSGSNNVNGTYSTDAAFSLGNASAAPVLNTALRHNALDTKPTPMTAPVGTGANSPGSIDATTPFTIELWFNNSVYDDRQDMIAMNGGGGSDFGLMIIGNGTSPGRLRVFHTTDIIPAASGPLVSINEWHHVVYTRDALGAATLYFDNVVAATGTDTNTFVSPAPVLGVGGKTTSNNRSFNGYIDEVAIYNVAFNAADVDSHYTAVVPVPEPASLGALGLGAVALLARRRQNRQ
jgi:hypothetical protein